jgi:hypothetical protein
VINLKTGITLMLLGIFGGVIGGYLIMQMTHKAVSAEQFILVDKKGKIHAMLGTTNLGTPSLGIWDKEGKNRLIIGFVGKGVPGIGLNDAKGTRRADFRITPDGKAGIVFYDETGNAMWSAPSEPESGGK